MLRALVAMTLAVVAFVMCIKYSDKISEKAKNGKEKNIYCGTLTQIQNSKSKNGVSFKYFILKNDQNQLKSFVIHYSVNEKQREMLQLNDYYCFNYYINLLYQSSVVDISNHNG